MKSTNIFLSLLFISLLSSPSWSETIDDLVLRDGLYYEKSTDVPFNGNITGLEQGSFKNGKKEGVWLWYWSNGQLSSKGNYNNGMYDGDWVGYRKDGTLVKEWTGTFKNGVKISD
ncbi:hypothetical protein OAD42_04115 [Oceanospirillaceae bacterium]|nr:hypothetical protein [Oceanospirillaceae bacterium]MDB9972317.1 hypothetical protein [Oceanospirillaceae bacterium]